MGQAGRRFQPVDFQALLDEITQTHRAADCPGWDLPLGGIPAFAPGRDAYLCPTVISGCTRTAPSSCAGSRLAGGDTPAFIVETQLQMLELLARAERLPECLPAVLALLRRSVGELRRRKIPLEKLLVSQKLSRNLEEYRTPSPAARAVAQLQATGKSVRRGQHVRFLYTRGEPRTRRQLALETDVRAWDLPEAALPGADLPGAAGSACVDTERYITLLLRAASTILQPMGVDERTLQDWVLGNAGYLTRPGYLQDTLNYALPLWAQSSLAIPS